MTDPRPAFTYAHLEWKLSARLQDALRYINSISKDDVMRCDTGCLTELVRQFVVAAPVLRTDLIVADERTVELVNALSDRKIGSTGHIFFIPIEQQAEWLEEIDHQIVATDNSPLAFLDRERSRLSIRLMLSPDDPEGELRRRLDFRVNLAGQYADSVAVRISESNRDLAEKVASDLNKRKSAILKAKRELDAAGYPLVYNPEQEERAIQVERLLQSLRGYTGEATRAGSAERVIHSFIVHGHDHASLYELKNYIQNVLDLGEPTVLRDRPGLGRTLIEKFENESDSIEVVFVLLTPDDLAGVSSSPDDLKRRARQNVILELGFFLGKLGRKSGRILVLYKGPLEIPSDIQGIEYIDITNGVESAGETIRRELRAVGIRC